MRKLKTKEKILLTALEIVSNEGVDQLSVTNWKRLYCEDARKYNNIKRSTSRNCFWSI